MAQMTDHFLNPLKTWPQPHALDFAGKLHEDVTIAPLPAGRCVHVDSMDTSKYEKIGGIPLLKTGVEGTQMPLFMFQGSLDTDVINADDSTPQEWIGFVPTGAIVCLVAVGAYELETSEFDTDRTYAPNDVLKAVAADTDDTPETGGGCLTNDCEVYTDAIVGVVSRGAYTNAYGKSALALWPVYVPADPCSTGPCGPQS
jgi:hypothetical protein